MRIFEFVVNLWGICGGMLVHLRATPSSMSPVPIYTLGWRETMWGKVCCLRKQHDDKDWASNYRPSDLKSNALTTTSPRRLGDKLGKTFHSQSQLWRHLGDSNFWVCGWNAMVWPSKWNLFSSTFTRYYSYLNILQIEFGIRLDFKHRWERKGWCIFMPLKVIVKVTGIDQWSL